MGKAFLLALVATLISPYAAAQVFACQAIDSIGFNSEGGNWKRTGFKPGKPFFLKIEQEELTKRSAADAMSTYPELVTCSKIEKTVGGAKQVHHCNDYSGILVFSPTTGNGSVAQLFGSAMPSTSSKKDSVQVTLFSCQKM